MLLCNFEKYGFCPECSQSTRMDWLALECVSHPDHSVWLREGCFPSGNPGLCFQNTRGWKPPRGEVSAWHGRDWAERRG